MTPHPDDQDGADRLTSSAREAVGALIRESPLFQQGDATQANSGGTNIANTGVIERLTVSMTAAPDQPSARAFVSCLDTAREWMESWLLPALDSLALHLSYNTGPPPLPEDWGSTYAALDRAALLIVVAHGPDAARDRQMRDQVAYWLDNHPDGEGTVVVARPGSPVHHLDPRLSSVPVVVVEGEDGDTARRLARVVRLTPRCEPVLLRDRPTEDEAALTPLRDAYLRWVAHTHRSMDSVIAGQPVTRPIVSCPPPGLLIRDGSTAPARVTEVDHLRSRAERRLIHVRNAEQAEFAVLADHPLPTYLAPAGPLERAAFTARAGLSPSHVVDTEWRCVVLGDPGSGKSSMVRRIAHDAAIRLLDSGTGEHGLGRLPVLCRAADLAAALGGTEESVEGLATLAIRLGWTGEQPADPLSGDRLSAQGLGRLARTALRQRRLLLVVDGLDEVPTLADRRLLTAMLDGFAAAGGARLDNPSRAPGNQAIITSRIAGYYGSPLGERFQQLLIGRLDDGGVRDVVNYWLTGYGDTTGRPPESQESMRSEVYRVLDSGGAGLRDLAANPYLLVALLSAVVSGTARLNGGDYSWLRGDLYATMVDNAIERGGLRVPQIPAATLTRLQAAVAYQMHSVSRSGLIDRDTLSRTIATAFTMVGEPLPADAARAELAITGLDLLVDRGQGLYGFRHMTVQEFFAGCRLIDAVEAEVVTERLVEHLGDTRWLEAVRLALGRLGRISTPLFDDVIGRLLSGPARRAAAEMISRSLADLVGLSPQHVRSLVRVAVEVESDHVDTADGGSHHRPTLLEPIVRWNGGVRGQSPVRVARDALCAHVRGESAPAAAAAARLIDLLRLDDRRTAGALYEAQYRDGPEHDWQVTRSLLAVQQRRLAAGRPVEAERVLSELTEPQHALLNALWDQVPAGRVTTGSRRPRMRGAADLAVPHLMRAALNDKRLLDRIHADIGWTRVFSCLYGGTAYLGTGRWLQRRRQAQAVLDAPGSTPAERRRAAVLLDTVIRPALDMAVAQAAVLQSDRIAVDTPLTAQVLAWLRDSVPSGELARRLTEIAGDVRGGPDARGDALAALLVLDTGDSPASVIASVISVQDASDKAVRLRARWRLGRTEMLFRDVLAALAPRSAAGALAVDGRVPADAYADVVRAWWTVGRPPSRTGMVDDHHHLAEDLVIAVCGDDDDKERNLAVWLDVVGRNIADTPGGLVRVLADVAGSESARWATTDDWCLDRPCPPGGDLAEALTVLAGLNARWGFLRCWFLDRLTSQIVAAGHVVEALCLAHEAAALHRTAAKRTMVRLITAHRGSVPSGQAQALAPDTMATRWLADPTGLPGLTGSEQAYPNLRGGIRHAAILGRRWSVRRLAGALARITDPHQRLRSVELAVRLRVVEPRPELLALAVETAGAATEPLAGACGYVRLAGSGLFPNAEDLLEQALERLLFVPVAQRTRVLSALPTARRDGLRALIDRHTSELPQRDQAIVRADTAAVLASYEPVSADTGHVAAWSALTTAAFCGRGLAALNDTAARFRTETACWAALRDAASRASAIAALRVRASREVAPLRLDETALTGLSALLHAGLADDAGDLLTMATAADTHPLLLSWQHHPDERFARLATLVLMETGHLDLRGVDRLPALLGDPDDRVRLRTRTAIASVNLGMPGPPRLRASRLGANTIAGLIRLLVDVRLSHRHLHADLNWAVRDILHDSPDILRAVLKELEADEEACTIFLRSLGHVAVPVLDNLPTLCAGLSNAGQMALLRALQAIAWTPDRFGLDSSQLYPLTELARHIVRTGGDDVAGEALRLLGLIAPLGRPAVETLLGEAIYEDDLAIAGCDALGHLLGRMAADASTVDVADAVSALRSLAADLDDELAVAATTALVRAGIAVEADPTLRPKVVLHALITAIDEFIVGDRWEHDVRRAARFVIAEATAGRDVPGGTLLGSLIGAGLDWIDARLGVMSTSPVRTFEGLAVMYGVGLEQPAALREALSRETRDLPGRLVALLDQEWSWLTRAVAGALLVILGDGNEHCMRTLLGLARDTDAVNERVLSALPWVDQVTPAGLAELVRATADPLHTKAYLAVEVLTSLAAQGVLAPGQQRDALAAVQYAIDRPDAGRHLLREYNGRIGSLGSLAEACRRAAERLDPGATANAHPVSDPSATVSLPVRGGRGETVALLLPTGVPARDALRHQLRHLATAEGIEIFAETLRPINALLDSAAMSGVSIQELVRLAGTQRAARAAQEGVALLLIMGRNTAGDEIYTYLRLPTEEVEQVKTFIAAGKTFVPSEWGNVVAAGRGVPTSEVTEEVGVPDFLLQFTTRDAAADPAET
ncbi:hypothetical protein [Micromonospora sp. NPDC048839]|uniref:hypothetical protein n=1 Tax=Micromonospora sp. NPDC048839 TaxID=3155641 RepID=UPI0033FD4C02